MPPMILNFGVLVLAMRSVILLKGGDYLYAFRNLDLRRRKMKQQAEKGFDKIAGFHILTFTTRQICLRNRISGAFLVPTDGGNPPARAPSKKISIFFTLRPFPYHQL